METMTNCLKTVGASLLNNQPEVSVMTISESKVITPPSQPKPELLPEHKMQMDHSKTHKVLSGWCAKSSTVDTDTKSGDVPANRENAVATKVLKAEEAHSEKINTEKLVVVKNDPVQLLLFGSKPTQEYQEASPVPKTKTGNGNVTHAIITSETSVNRPVIVVPSSINAEWITKMIEAGAFRQGLPPDMSILEKFTAQNIQVSNGDQRDMEPTGQPSTVLEVEEAQAEPIKEEMNSHLKKEEKAWLAVFSRLTRRDLCTVMLVCKQFHDWALSSDFWETIKLTRAQLTSSHFTGLIKRQPMDLNLGSNILFCTREGFQ